MKRAYLCLVLAACATKNSPAHAPPDAGPDAESLYLEGKQKAQAGQLAEAEALFRKASALDFKMVQAVQAMGDAQYAQAKYHEAAESYSNAIKLDPQKAMAWVGLSRAYSASGRTEEAYEAVTKARTLNDKTAAVWVSVAPSPREASRTRTRRPDVRLRRPCEIGRAHV